MFDHTFNSSHSTKHKPHPEPYLNAINYFNLKPSECMVIEDSVQGVSSGKRAGCYVVALKGSIDEKFLKDADVIISSLFDLEKLL